MEKPYHHSALLLALFFKEGAAKPAAGVLSPQ